MGKGRKIVVAVDEGEESMYALSWCLENIVVVSDQKQQQEEEEDQNDTLVLLYSRPPRHVFTAMDGTGYLFSSDVVASMERYSHNVADFVMEKAKRVCGNGRRNLKVETKVESGDPRDVICEVVEKLSADLLVMGSHGYGFIKRALIGSVSNHCAQNVKCPVLIVKRPKQCVGDGHRSS